MVRVRRDFKTQSPSWADESSHDWEKRFEKSHRTKDCHSEHTKPLKTQQLGNSLIKTRPKIWTSPQRKHTGGKQHVQWCYVSFVVREKEIKASSTAHLSGWSKSRILTPPKAGEAMEKREVITSRWWECKMTLWKTLWWFLIKLHILLPYSLTVTLPGIYRKKLKTNLYTENLRTDVYSTCTQQYGSNSKSFNRWMDLLTGTCKQ